jgi:RHS repeat-associated protein
LTTTRDLRYQGDAIVEESTNGTVSRGYLVDETGRILKVCDPSCAAPTTTYLVAWNGHGDALGLWQINADGSLTLANSYTYSSWGSPTTTVASGFADLGFRFLYVGATDVQWDDFSGLGLAYMHARHYSPAIGRFLQPDPARAEANGYGYAGDSPVAKNDPSGMAFSGNAPQALRDFCASSQAANAICAFAILAQTQAERRMYASVPIR